MTLPRSIIHYPMGNQDKQAINQKLELVCEYSQKEIKLRPMGTRNYLSDEEAEKIQKTFTEAIDRFNRNIEQVFSREPFSIIKKTL